MSRREAARTAYRRPPRWSSPIAGAVAVVATLSIVPAAVPATDSASGLHPAAGTSSASGSRSTSGSVSVSWPHHASASRRPAASGPVEGSASIAPSGGDARSPGFRFVEVGEEAGLVYEHGFDREGNRTMAERMAAGVAVGDYDGDGWIDLFVVRGDRGPAMLFHNQGDGTFVDVAADARLDLRAPDAVGPTFGDVDGDRRLDLVVGGIHEAGPRLFQNRANGRFKEITRRSRVRSDKNTFSAAFADTDRDGDLDLFLSHWDWECEGDCGGGHLWEKRAGVRYRPADRRAGIAGFREKDFSFTPNFADIDDDGWPDLLLAADFGTSRVLLNDGSGAFVDVTDPEVITDDNGMGATVGDYDNDGDLDWFVTSIIDYGGALTGNRLYRNRGDGVFDDATSGAGVRDGGWGWGACTSDFDNDGDLDLLHVNGWYPEAWLTHRSRLFLNRGDGTFREAAREHRLEDASQGRGLSCFDYDRDGDVDVFVSVNQGAPRLFRNDGGNDGRYLQVALEGRPPNAWAVGARIRVRAGGRVQMREVRMGNNFLSQDPTEVHFGLGEARRVDLLEVRWPDGEVRRLRDVRSNQLLRIRREPERRPGS